MDTEDREPQNPYTFLEGYTLQDKSGADVGEVDRTIYDAPSNVLKYVLVDGHTVPADRIEVNADERIVSAPYDRETIESAPALRETSGAFDTALHEHYAAES